MITPVNVDEIIGGLERICREFPAFANVRIDVAEPPDTYPEVEGWIGLYRTRASYPARTLGAGIGYRRQEVELVAQIRAQNLNSGRACASDLEVIVQNFISCILSEGTLGNTVDAIGEDLRVDYTLYDKQNEAYIQEAFVFVTGITNVR